jgi:integrase
LVFTAPEGGPLRHANFYKRVWLPAKQAAGVPEDLRIHDLRHTCAALLIAQGASPKAIQAHLGHSSIQVTFDRYGHLFPEDLEELAADSTRHVKSVARTRRGPGVVELPTERPETALQQGI